MIFIFTQRGSCYTSGSLWSIAPPVPEVLSSVSANLILEKTKIHHRYSHYPITSQSAELILCLSEQKQFLRQSRGKHVQQINQVLTKTFKLVLLTSHCKIHRNSLNSPSFSLSSCLNEWRLRNLLYSQLLGHRPRQRARCERERCQMWRAFKQLQVRLWLFRLL